MTVLSCSLFLALLIVSTYFPRTLRAFPQGAPCTVESSLQPNPGAHGPDKNSAGKKNAPFRIVLNGTDGSEPSCIRRNEIYTMTLRSDLSSTQFRGFAVKSVSAKSNRKLGEFQIKDGASDKYKYMCSDSNSSVTHKSPKSATSAGLTWVLSKENDDPSDDTVQFHSTVVEELDNYWTNVNSKVYPKCN